MRKHVTRFRHAGSFTAGLLIGLSIMLPMFAMMLTNPGDWQLAWVFGALVVLAVGIKLQAVVTIKARRRRTIAPKVRLLPVGFMEMKLEQ